MQMNHKRDDGFYFFIYQTCLLLISPINDSLILLLLRNGTFLKNITHNQYFLLISLLELVHVYNYMIGVSSNISEKGQNSGAGILNCLQETPDSASLTPTGKDLRQINCSLLRPWRAEFNCQLFQWYGSESCSLIKYSKHYLDFPTGKYV